MTAGRNRKMLGGDFAHLQRVTGVTFVVPRDRIQSEIESLIKQQTLPTKSDAPARRAPVTLDGVDGALSRLALLRMRADRRVNRQPENRATAMSPMRALRSFSRQRCMSVTTCGGTSLGNRGPVRRRTS